MSFGPEWTDDEIARVLQLRDQGMSSSKIGAAVGRSRNAISGLIYRLRAQGTAVCAPRGNSRQFRKPKARPPRIERPELSVWERSDRDRRLTFWLRARAAAAEALHRTASDSPDING